MSHRGPAETHLPRRAVQLGHWEASAQRLKIYVLALEETAITQPISAEARTFVEQDIPPAVTMMGEDNGLGFVILHPGTAGLTVSAFWWAQGSVLCHRMYRRLWSEDRALDPTSRPVVGCVYELALIDAEHRVWRETMMGPRPDPEAYLATWAPLRSV